MAAEPSSAQLSAQFQAQDLVIHLVFVGEH